MHDYTGNASVVQRRIEGAYKRYGRQVWLTEVRARGPPASPPRHQGAPQPLSRR